jgi:hypothetical protein
MKRIKRGFKTVLVAATVAALAAIAVSQAAPTPAPLHHVLSTRRSHIGSFSVLHSARAATSGAAGLSAATVKHLTEPGTLVAEMELEPARSVSVEINSTQVWVTPGRNGMCLAVDEPLVEGRVCGSLANANAGGLVMVQRPISGPAVVYGVVPDGASVSITNTDGSSTSVPVTSNVFMLADPTTAQSVSVRPVGGPVNTTPVN